MLKELIDKFYLDQQRDRQQLHFYITDAGKCARQVFFKFKQAPREKMDARIMRIFDFGETLHRNIFNVLYRLRIGVTTEVKIPAQELVSGRADAILTIDGENYVMDIKSINSMIFANMKEPKIENVYQIQLYLHYFNIKKGILLYIDKDKQDIKEFIIDYDAELCNRLLNEFKVLKGKIDNDTIPVTLPDYPDNWQCSYCPYREVCDTAGVEEVDWKKVKEKIEQTNESMF